MTRPGARLRSWAARVVDSSTMERLIDPAIADRTITGLFVSNDPVGFARAAALSLNLRADVSEGAIRITR